MAVGVNIVSDFDSKGIRKAITDFGKLQGVGNKATFGLRTMDKAVTNGIANVAKYGGLLAAGLGGFALFMVKGAELAKAADDRLVAVANSMDLFGGQTQVVVGRLIKLADAQEYELGVTAETIKLTQAKLLTFKELAVTAGKIGGAFDRATKAAIDLGAAGFGEASQNATQLGKALNDPIKGLTALARSGVTFTAQEKEKIKTLVESGKMLQAQDTLLKAIETQVGGTAAATTTDTFRISMAFGHVRDVIGTLLLPIFEKFANFLINTVVPYATKVEKAFGEKGVAGGFQMLGSGLLNVIEDGGKVINIILGLVAAFTALRLIAIAAAISQNLFNVALLANPIGIIVAALIAVGVAVVAAYIKFEKFRTIVHSVINFLISAFERMVNYWIGKINMFIRIINFFRPLLNKIGIEFDELGEHGKVSFGRIGGAAKVARKEVSKTLGLIQSAKNAERLELGLKPNFTGSGGDEDEFGGGGKGESAIEKAKKALEKYIDAIKGVTQAQKQLRDANKGVTEANETLAEKMAAVTDAQKKFALVTKGYALDSKEVVKQTREVADAQRNLVKANISAADSVQAVKDAEEALRKLREKVDPFDIESAEIKLQKAKFNVEEANFAVLEAEKDLAELRKDKETTPAEIRKAEIKLAESKFNVRDAVKSVKDAEKELVKLRTDTPTLKEIAEAERAVANAKLAAEDASIAQADAQTAVNQAQEKLNELVNGAKEGSEAYTEALKELRDAEKAQREAIDARTAAYERQAEAVEALMKAEKERAGAGKEISAKDRKAADADAAAAVAAITAITAAIPSVVVATTAATDAVAEVVKKVEATQFAVSQSGAKMSDIAEQTAIAKGFLTPAQGAALFARRVNPFAEGGIVKAPTLGLVGERGREAIIPLDRMGSLGNTYNIQVTAGMGADGKDIGTQIVNALKRYERTNGALPLTVA